jgi:hypothetical protein
MSEGGGCLTVGGWIVPDKASSLLSLFLSWPFMKVLAFDEGEGMLVSVGGDSGTVGYRDEKDDISMCFFQYTITLPLIEKESVKPC